MTARRWVYKLEETIQSIILTTLKVISYVATDSLMPVERDFYDRAGKLPKTEHCTIETTVTAQKVPDDYVKNVDYHRAEPGGKAFPRLT